ncbi:MAG TPA: hypothetical protein VGJ38_08320 [Jatrophihabitantaceae bacterium]
MHVFQRAALIEAAEAIGDGGPQPHEPCHTAASLAVAAGANIKVVQTMLGRKSATMTLDPYAHLFPDQQDQVADALDAARAASVAHLLPSGKVIRLAAGAETTTTPPRIREVRRDT